MTSVGVEKQLQKRRLGTAKKKTFAVVQLVLQKIDQ